MERRMIDGIKHPEFFRPWSTNTNLTIRGDLIPGFELHAVGEVSRRYKSHGIQIIAYKHINPPDDPLGEAAFDAFGIEGFPADYETID